MERNGRRDAFLDLITRLSERDTGRMGTPPAAKEAVEKLETVKVTPDMHDSEEQKCPVCQEKLEGEATKMPCGHLFDNDCLKPWLHQHNSCPVCRFELPTEDPDYERQKANKEAQAQEQE